MDSHPTTLILSGLGIAGTVVVYLFCVLSNEAILRSRGGPLRERARQGSRSAKLGRVVIGWPERYIITSQVWMVLCCLLAGFLLVRLSLVDVGAAWLSGLLGIDPSYGAVIELIMMLSGALLVAAVTVFLAQFARALARGRPEDVLCRCAPVLIGMSRILSPVIKTVQLLAGRFLQSLGSQLPAGRQRAISVNEINELVQSGAIAGEIEQEDKELLDGVFSFSQTVVREVMTPRHDIVSIDETASLDTIVDLFVSEGFSRILVVGSGLDDVKGILIAKDFLPFIGKPDPDFTISSYLRKAYIVPVSKAVDDLLREMRRDSVHFAVVVDEHGGTDGIVTIEDLLEEIVGEIFDEFDAPEEEVEVIKTKSGDILADGSVTIDDLNDIYHFDFPDGDYDTLAGFILQQLGHIPKLGETLEYRGLVLRIEQLSRNRIKLVRIVGRKNNSKTSDLPHVAEARSEPDVDPLPVRILKTGT